MCICQHLQKGKYLLWDFWLSKLHVTDVFLLSKDEQQESNNARYDPQQHSASPSESMLDRCQPTNGPSGEEYHVLIKKGTEIFIIRYKMGTWLRRKILSLFLPIKIAKDDIQKLSYICFWICAYQEFVRCNFQLS